MLEDTHTYNVAYDLQPGEVGKEQTIHPSDDVSGRRVCDLTRINET